MHDLKDIHHSAKINFKLVEYGFKRQCEMKNVESAYTCTIHFDTTDRLAKVSFLI